MRKTLLDNGFHSYLSEGAHLIGTPQIPALLDFNNTSVPARLIPYSKARMVKSKRGYIHFYMHDERFWTVLYDLKKHIELFQQFDGIITPDPTLDMRQSRCLQETTVWFRQAVGHFAQTNGIPVIPNVRWGDESTFDFCFLGIPHQSIVSISTHGFIHSRELKNFFRQGLHKMIEELKPTDVLVHGYMPDEIFDDYINSTQFHRYPSEFENTHSR